MYEIFINGKVNTNVALDPDLEENVSWPDGIFEIMRSCWELNPDDRPSFIDLNASFLSSKQYCTSSEFLSDKGCFC